MSLEEVIKPCVGSYALPPQGDSVHISFFFFKFLMYRYLSLLSTHLFAQSFILVWTCISLLCLNSAWQLKKIEIHFLTILTARSLRSVGLFPNETSLLGFQMAAFSLHAHGERSEGERFLLSPALKRALVLLE